jgi:UDP-N-acetylmuramate dehydrogenase
MTISKDYDLIKLNTFGISAKAKFFVEIENQTDLFELFDDPIFKNNEKLFLGGGSNVLFTKDFDGIVILNKMKGIEIVREDEDEVLLRAMSGEIWSDLVNFSVEHNYWGIENLSLIYGTVGAAPMQNIGAYGVELKDVLEQVETIEIKTGEKKIFSNHECELGYRDSVFKNRLKGQFFISSIVVRLNKKEKINIEYKVLKEYLIENKIIVQKSKDISDAVAHIRKSKLPDPSILGNAGSFFKNVFVDAEKVQNLLEDFREMPYFKEDDFIKIPAGWLIEQCGPANGISWKGYRIGNVGVHEKQALVIVNHGGATGEEIKDFVEQIISSVYAKFGLKLVPEVNLI